MRADREKEIGKGGWVQEEPRGPRGRQGRKVAGKGVSASRRTGGKRVERSKQRDALL